MISIKYLLSYYFFHSVYRHVDLYFIPNTDDAVLCPGLPDPARGQVESNGVTASYTCEENLSLVGERERRCDTENGQWLGEAPVCSAG